MFGSKTSAVKGKIEKATEALAKELMDNRFPDSKNISVSLSYQDACYLCAAGLVQVHSTKSATVDGLELSFHHPSFQIVIKD